VNREQRRKIAKKSLTHKDPPNKINMPLYCYNCGQKLDWLYSDLDELIDFEYGESEVEHDE
jgi:hypothetical protein